MCWRYLCRYRSGALLFRIIHKIISTMKIPRIKAPHKNISDANITDLAAGVLKNMTDNPNFPNATERLAPVRAAYEAYRASIPSRADRSESLTAIKNEKKAALRVELLALIGYINSQPGLSLAVLETTGFPLANKPTPRGMPGIVQDLKLRTNGEPGLLLVSCSRDPNATVYIARAGTKRDDGSIDIRWVHAGTSRTVPLRGVVEMQSVFVSMCAVNSRHDAPWSAWQECQLGDDRPVVRSVNEFV